MDVLKLIFVPLAAAVFLMLHGCGADAVKPDQVVTLQPGQGIAAVVIDALDPLDNITIKSPDNTNAPELVITGVKAGTTMLVYVVPAGRYCVDSFYFDSWRFIQSDLKHGVCFDVIAGEVAYSGNIGPRVYRKKVWTAQNYDWNAFRKQLSRQYPKLAGYPIVTP